MPLRTSSASFTRPADITAYTSGDLMADSTTAGSVTPLAFESIADSPGGRIRIHRIRLHKSGTSITTCSVRLHLYTVSPTVANGDNGAMSSTQAATWLGGFDMTLTQAFSDGAAANVTPTLPLLVRLEAGVGRILGLLEARSIYTPASGEVFTATLEVETA